MDNSKNIKPDIEPGPIAWMAGNSVASNLLMIVFLVGGLIWGTMIKQEVFPEFDLDIITISVAYPGASPEEVEQGIILVIEEAVQGLEGIKEVTSSANEGSGFVSVEALAGTDIQKLANDIQSEVDRINSFPEDSEDPKVSVAIRRREVISLVLYGDQDERILRELAENIRDSLLQNKSITQVDLSEVRDFEISIEVSQEKLRSLNITLDDIARRVDAASIELPGGRLKTPSGEVLVRMKERRDYGHEFARIPIITQKDGTQVLLEDIALIKDGFEDTDTYASYNGRHAVMIDVYRVGEQTPIEVADAVKTYVSELRESLPPGVEVDTLNDRSDYYRQRLNLLVKNGWMGLCLVFIMLGLFLEARLAFWVALGIPISFLGSLLFLPFAGVSINMISMFAFIIALGIVVDDAIVVGENIFTMRQQGVPFLQAAVLGAREVAMPVTFSILTNIVAFMPLYFVPGIMGKVFGTIPIVVIIVFCISLVESLFILPAHLGHLKAVTKRGPMAWINHWQQKFSRGFIRLVKEVYDPFLDIALRSRYLVLAIGISVLILILAVVKSGRMGMTLFPRIESDYARASVSLPYGSAVEKTEAVQKKIVDAAKELAEETGGSKQVTGIFARIGGSSGSHTADIRAYLTPPGIRQVSTEEFTRRWREKVGLIPGLENLNFRSDSGGPGSGASLTVELSHRDINVLEAASEELAEALNYFPNVRDIDDGFSPGKQQIDFTIRAEGRALGLTAQTIARQVRHAFYGTEVLRQQRGRNEITVMVRLPESERVSEYNLEELMIRTPSGAEVPLRQVVNVKRGRAYTSINRRDGRRIVSVTADVIPTEQANQVLQAVKADTLPYLLEKYPGLRFSFEGRQADTRESMNSLFSGLGISMLIIFALLAIPFRSYTQPAIVMVSIPFGIVGAVLGHMIMGYSLSVMSMFGIVALSGVVVNGSLVLIDFANRKRNDGMEIHDAIHAAGIQRFRPILLTTLTTFGGLSPMIFETSRQARYLIPMALSLGYGVLFATLITLILVPCLYLILEDFHQIKLWIWPEAEKELNHE
ncbi:Acriflavin resistance protein [Desulfonema limicola]|uniref:Acriflavin resistance protein n=1 Tax=Desulfonema limicola TaxID=45656 RepID=A0A975B8L6_9BACT|nr:efflux RND transporter permease subunit [Desulfonema limicola]QTA80812.1 Acriflavin resistance protein [Desulfonema limicola]